MVLNKPLVVVLFLILLGGCAALKYKLFNDSTPRLLFSHEKHTEQEIECETCHMNVSESKTVSDNNLPKEEDCLLCHERGESQEECVLCHTNPQSPKPLVVKTSDLKFSHKRHYEEEIECEICHATEDSEISLPNWSECSECHEISNENCDFCHTKVGISKELVPASHDAFWISEHQVEAVQNNKLCETCHKVNSENKGFCTSCHRGDVVKSKIHDPNYVHLHMVDVKSKRGSCSTCHQDDFCSSCHNKLETSFFQIHGEGWILDKSSSNFHGNSARRNLPSCVSCHDENSCIVCHSSISPHPEGYRSRISSRIAIQHQDSSVCLKCHQKEDLCSRCHPYKD